MKRKLKKIFIFALSLLLLFPILGQTIQASAQSDNDVSYTQEDVDNLAHELEVYFSEVGHLNNNNEYVISDQESFISKVKSDGFDMYQTRGAKEFGICILKDQVGPYLDLLSGDIIGSIANYLKGEAWDEAARLILKYVGLTGKKLNAGVLAAGLAASAFGCRGEL